MEFDLVIRNDTIIDGTGSITMEETSLRQEA